MPGALHGVKVLELSRVLAGPWCGMMLADLGADVIKLEPPEGDDTRGLGPPFLADGANAGLSAYFACCNRNKRSIALDLRDAQSRPTLEALLRWADVLIENFRTGATQALGIDYTTVSALNPRLVYCSITGYGSEGEHAARAGYDFVIQAEAGLMSLNGEVDGAPHKVGVAVADLATGQNAAIAILAALRHRDATGRGQHVAVSLFDAQLANLANVASNVLFTGGEARRYGNAHANIVPYQSFRAADGEFALAVASEKLWRAFCAAIERPEWVAEPRCATNAARVAQRAWLCAQLDVIFATQSVQVWLQRLQAAGVPCAPVNSVRAALGHPLAQTLRIETDGVPMLGSPLRLSATPVRYQRAPPRLNQHGAEIAAMLGTAP